MSSKKEKELRRLAQTPPGQDPFAVQGYRSVSFEYKSILPPAGELERLEKLSPGITTRILETFEKQSKHRQELEKFVIAGDSRRADIGQWLAFALGIVTIVGGFVLVGLGFSGIGIASLITAAGTLLTAFFGGALLRKMERQKKNAVIHGTPKR
jgi:uncharacterized membrane protein